MWLWYVFFCSAKSKTRSPHSLHTLFEWTFDSDGQSKFQIQEMSKPSEHYLCCGCATVKIVSAIVIFYWWYLISSHENYFDSSLILDTVHQDWTLHTETTLNKMYKVLNMHDIYLGVIVQKHQQLPKYQIMQPWGKSGVEGIIAVLMFAFHFHAPDHIHEQGRRRGEVEVDKGAKRAVALESGLNPVHTGFAVFLPFWLPHPPSLPSPLVFF